MEAFLGAGFTVFLAYVFIIRPAIDYGEGRQKKETEEAARRNQKPLVDPDRAPLHTCHNLLGPSMKTGQYWKTYDL